MADVVNLRTARKAKARALREADAQANRAKFGRTKGQRQREEQEAERMARLLDGAKREEP